MKKVLFFINTLSGGGAEKVLTTTVNHLDLSKYEITIYTLFDNGIYHKDLNSKINCKSLIRVGNKMFRNLFAYLFQFVIPAQWIYRCFVGDNYDVEIAYLEGFPTKLIAASNNKKSKKYAWVHIDLDKFYDSGRVFKNVKDNTNAYKKYDSVFCVSEDVRSGFYKRFGKLSNIYIQYNVVNDIDILQKSIENNPFIDEKNNIKLVAVGRLCEQKGFERLIRVAKKLISDGFDFELYILGEGEDKIKLEQLIDCNGLENIVRLVGFKKNPYKYISNSDIFVCSSFVEGYSTVVTEAIILGKAILTTDCTGMREILGDNKFGVIVENTEEGLYCGLKELLSSPDYLNYYSDKAKLRANDFSMKKRISEYEQIIDS